MIMTKILPNIVSDTTAKTSRKRRLRYPAENMALPITANASAKMTRRQRRHLLYLGLSRRLINHIYASWANAKNMPRTKRRKTYHHVLRLLRLYHAPRTDRKILYYFYQRSRHPSTNAALKLLHQYHRIQQRRKQQTPLELPPPQQPPVVYSWREFMRIKLIQLAVFSGLI
jgi:hypothetical protein